MVDRFCISKSKATVWSVCLSVCPVLATAQNHSPEGAYDAAGARLCPVFSTQWARCVCVCSGRWSTSAPPDGGRLTTVSVDSKMSAPVSGGGGHWRGRRCTELSIDTVQLGSHDLHTRAKCRWTYNYNTDPDRLPRTLVEAQCSQLTGVDGLRGQCEHVYYYVPVRQNVAGTWTDRWIRLRVGCTLATPVTAPPVTQDWLNDSITQRPFSSLSLVQFWWGEVTWVEWCELSFIPAETLEIDCRTTNHAKQLRSGDVGWRHCE